jgi:hypothetical protein
MTAHHLTHFVLPWTVYRHSRAKGSRGDESRCKQSLAGQEPQSSALRRGKESINHEDRALQILNDRIFACFVFPHAGNAIALKARTKQFQWLQPSATTHFRF